MVFDFDALAQSFTGRRFQSFDPVLTYSCPDNDRFIEVNGKSGKKLTPDTDALFHIGKVAFERIAHGEGFSKEEFDEAYATYWAALDSFRDLLSDLHDQEKMRMGRMFLLILALSMKRKLPLSVGNFTQRILISLLKTRGFIGNFFSFTR